MAEQTDEDTLQMAGEIDDKSRKAQKLPLSFVFNSNSPAQLFAIDCLTTSNAVSGLLLASLTK